MRKKNTPSEVVGIGIMLFLLVMALITAFVASINVN